MISEYKEEKMKLISMETVYRAKMTKKLSSPIVKCMYIFMYVHTHIHTERVKLVQL